MRIVVTGLSGGRGALTLLMVVLLALLPAAVLANPGVADAGELDELPSVESLLQRYVEAAGGREAILALRTRATVG